MHICKDKTRLKGLVAQSTEPSTIRLCTVVINIALLKASVSATASYLRTSLLLAGVLTQKSLSGVTWVG
jgi:hypothetical protein